MAQEQINDFSNELTQSKHLIFALGAVGIIIILMSWIVAAIIRNRRLKRLEQSGIYDIDQMSGREFEEYLGQLFKFYGYSVIVTKEVGDFGADLVLSKDGIKIVVQAKRYSKNIGVKAVQEVHSAISYYNASEAWVVSNSGYTKAAITLAKTNNVRLIDRDELIEWCIKMNSNVLGEASGAR
ncbi:restriction endonuclease [Paenibacillus allorhizosphaerae]|uniref:Restriction endonuclease type IV Mrr domain-containing protein n=1 Tax=Paenibacillus allorhizosphaerae TaxID=2849866 RepID=A0ABM8VNB7_9BACL|nr:restriction endonuclease [Paenibacillus allorhizosphaerae]CAG7651263.1 hypothetical protein PAECIP111802_04920 [Paenibacillus allorhizosphaerae]